MTDKDCKHQCVIIDCRIYDTTEKKQSLGWAMCEICKKTLDMEIKILGMTAYKDKD